MRSGQVNGPASDFKYLDDGDFPVSAPDWPDCFQDAREQIQRQLRILAADAKSTSPVSEFLQQAVESSSSIYAATAAALWLLDSRGNQLRLVAQHGYARLGLDDDYDPPHRSLLQCVLERPDPVVVAPNAAVAGGARSPAGGTIANPTDSFLVLGVVRHDGEPLGVLELGLGPRPPRGRTAAARDGYARFLKNLLALIEAGLRCRAEAGCAEAGRTEAGRTEAGCAEAGRTEAANVERQTGRPTTRSALEVVSLLERDLAGWRSRLRDHLQQHLAALAGTRGETLKDNQTLAKQVQRLLDGNSLRVQCPECGHAAILRCQSAGGTRAGLFVYDHYLPQGRTFHGGQAAFPLLTLVDKPPRKVRGQEVEPA